MGHLEGELEQILEEVGFLGFFRDLRKEFKASGSVYYEGCSFHFKVKMQKKIMYSQVEWTQGVG